MILADHSENHKYNQQVEIQRACFGHENSQSVAIQSVAKQPVTVIWESSDHSRIAAMTCVNVVINEMKE